MDDQLKNHIFVPLPSLKDQPRPGSQSHEERLKAIISNLDQHHNNVRHNIVTAAIKRKEAAATSSSKILTTTQTPPRTHYEGNNEDEEMTDISPTSPSQAPHSPDPSPIPNTDATQPFLAALKAPHDPRTGDPCLKPRARHLPASSEDPPQKPLSPEQRLATVTLEQLRAYDEHARMGKEYFVRALERRRSSTSSVVVPPPRPASAAGDVHPDRAAWMSGRMVQSPREMQGSGDPRMGGVTDPRLRSR